MCTHIHCSNSFASRNVSNALLLIVRGPQLFRTHCSQHVSPATMLRTTCSTRNCLERVVRNIAAGETRCEQGVLNSCGARKTKNRAFETLRLEKLLEQCICVHICMAGELEYALFPINLYGWGARICFVFHRPVWLGG